MYVHDKNAIHVPSSGMKLTKFAKIAHEKPEKSTLLKLVQPGIELILDIYAALTYLFYNFFTALEPNSRTKIVLGLTKFVYSTRVK